MSSRGSAGRGALFVAVAVLLVAAAVQRGWAWQHERSRAEDREKAVAAASSEVTRLITISAKGSDAALDELLDGATASFRRDLEEQASRLSKALAANKVKATGDVIAAGLVKQADEQATVIVAADGTVVNLQSATPQKRQYKVKVELRSVDGRWLVSGLEFVA